jgi:hypothetical protein
MVQPFIFGENTYLDNIKNIEATIIQRDWEKVTLLTTEIKKLYKIDKDMFDYQLSRVKLFLTNYDSCLLLLDSSESITKYKQTGYYYASLANLKEVYFTQDFMEYLYSIAIKIDTKVAEIEKQNQEKIQKIEEAALEEKIAGNLCNLINRKKYYEEAIIREKEYSEKYGVINLSKIDEYKQEIIQIDAAIIKYSQLYKEKYGKEFNIDEWKGIDFPNIIAY